MIRRAEPAAACHVAPLLAALPAEEVAELAAVAGMDADAALNAAIERSDYARALLAGGDVLAVFGAVRDGEIGRAWMLGTPATSRHARWFCEETRRQLAAMLTVFPELRAMVDVRYRRSFRWMRFLGWRIGFPVLVAGHLLCPVEVSR